MRFLLCLALVLPAASFAGVETVRCRSHSNTLQMRATGTEHVSHRVTVNHAVRVRESEQESWFVEKASCTATGFLLAVSHRPYGDSTIAHIHVRPLKGSRYALERRV